MGPVLVATDLGNNWLAVVRAGAELASRLGTSLDILHVIGDAERDEYRSASPDEYVDTFVSDVQGDLLGARSEIDDDPGGETTVELGSVPDTVARLTEERGASYLVIGIRNRSRLGKLVLGSAAHSLMMGSPVPVVGVPISKMM